MEAGIHLPQIAFTGRPARETVETAIAVTRAARDHGLAALSANDHLDFPRPWVDGLTLLAVAAKHAGRLDLVTSIALASVRGPVPVAAALTTLAATAEGRVIAGVGPGSSKTDHRLANLPWQQRWSRHDEAVRALTSLLAGHGIPPGLRWWPESPQPASVLDTGYRMPLWLASWGGSTAMARVAEHGQGWLGSAHHCTPAQIGANLRALDAALAERGRSGADVEHAVVTLWTFVTERPRLAEDTLTQILAPALGRDPESLRPLVCIGSVDECAARVAAFAEQGVRRLHFWPVTDEVRQVALLADRVLPAADR